MLRHTEPPTVAPNAQLLLFCKPRSVACRVLCSCRDSQPASPHRVTGPGHLLWVTVCFREFCGPFESSPLVAFPSAGMRLLLAPCCVGTPRWGDASPRPRSHREHVSSGERGPRDLRPVPGGKGGPVTFTTPCHGLGADGFRQ